MTGRNSVGRVADFLSIATVIVSAVLLVVKGSAAEFIMAAALSVIAITMTVVALAQSKQLSDANALILQRESFRNAIPKFSDAVDGFKRAYRTILALHTNPGGSESARSEFVACVSQACKDVAESFQQMTGHPCRVTLQELYSEVDPAGAILAAVRAVASSDRNARLGEDSVDLVVANSDFTLLVAGGEYFFSNDLRTSLQEGYKNSHWNEEKLKQWRLDGGYPYLSTIVWPIRARADGAWDLVGFLSLDSKDEDAFDVLLLNPLGASLAGVAYTGLSLTRAMIGSQLPEPDEGKG